MLQRGVHHPQQFKINNTMNQLQLIDKIKITLKKAPNWGLLYTYNKNNNDYTLQIEIPETA